jgi:hypothetical protein
MQEAKKARKEGEKVYSLDEVAKKLGIDLWE